MIREHMWSIAGHIEAGCELGIKKKLERVFTVLEYRVLANRCGMGKWVKQQESKDR